MNQYLLVKAHQIGVANLGKSFAKAGPMSEVSALAAAIGVGLIRDRRLDLAHFPCASE